MSDKIRVRNYKYPVKEETNHLLKPRAIMALVKTELYLKVLGKRFKEDLCVSIECLLGFVSFLNWVFFQIWALNRVSVFLCLLSLNRVGV